MRSSFIDWLIEQQYRPDDVGNLSRWVLAESEFEPLELNDILDRINADPDNTVEDPKKMKEHALSSLVEYGNILYDERDNINLNIISDEAIQQEKLNIAIRNENYEEAAKLRDKINKNEKK